MKRLILVLCLLLTACSSPVTMVASPTQTPTPTCAQRAQPYLDLYKPLRNEFAGAYELASRTPRISLSAQIQRLQEIRSKVAALPMDPCLEALRDHQLTAMQYDIDTHLAFLSDSDTVSSIQMSTFHVKRATEEMSKIADAIENGTDYVPVP